MVRSMPMGSRVATILVLALLMLLVANPVAAKDGGDIAGPIGEGAFMCFSNLGWEFIVVRGWKGDGTVDVDALPSLQNAADVNISYFRDIYMDPCVSKDPSVQVNAMVSAIGADNFDGLWLTVENNTNPGCGWSPSNKSANCDFLRTWLVAASQLSDRIGVRVSAPMWSAIVGDDCPWGYALAIELWWVNLDGSQTDGGFKPFGFWDSPWMKQYNTKTAFNCGAQANVDWYDDNSKVSKH